MKQKSKVGTASGPVLLLYYLIVICYANWQQHIQIQKCKKSI